MKEKSPNDLRLVDIYKAPESFEALFRLLKSRDPRANISHRKMPSWNEHVRFVRSKPHKAWYLIKTQDGVAGGIYLSKNDEIGLFIFKHYQGKGYGKKALTELMKKHTKVRKFLANISPLNARSRRFFEGLGFRHIQNTYELLTKREPK